MTYLSKKAYQRGRDINGTENFICKKIECKVKSRVLHFIPILTMCYLE